MIQSPKVLKPTETYTFSRYFELPYDIEDVLNDLGCQFDRRRLTLPQGNVTDEAVQAVKAQIEDGVQYVGLRSEQARREFLIRTVCRVTDRRVRVEYPVTVCDWLKGTLDYYFSGENLLVIEAKRDNLDNGFTQLAAELIALDQWSDSSSPILYGAVTTGRDWQFGLFERQARRIVQDLDLYRVPEELVATLSVLVGILDQQTD